MTVPAVVRRIFSRTPRQPPQVVLPIFVWGTKGFQFWSFLSLLLDRSKCSRILELGSGRSTITLAEYAAFRNARFISIETDVAWFNKARWELLCLGMSDAPVRLVKWQSENTWYDIEQFRATVHDAETFDFAFIDGPNDNSGKSRGIRDNELALREILRCISGADIVVVDDVHRRHILDSIDRMLIDPKWYDKFFYDYSVQSAYPNTICICIKKSSPVRPEIGRIQEMLGMHLSDRFDEETCPEE